MATRCPICNAYWLKSDAEKAAGVCRICEKLPGFFRLPPLARALRPCAACDSREFVRAVAFDRGATGDDATPYAAPLAVAFRQSVNRTSLGTRPVSVGHAVGNPAGWLELLICRACGLVIWNALEPHRIPIGPEYGTELVRAAEADGPPYR
jgi:hypothetical protein